MQFLSEVIEIVSIADVYFGALILCSLLLESRTNPRLSVANCSTLSYRGKVYSPHLKYRRHTVSILSLPYFLLFSYFQSFLFSSLLYFFTSLFSLPKAWPWRKGAVGFTILTCCGSAFKPHARDLGHLSLQCLRFTVSLRPLRHTLEINNQIQKIQSTDKCLWSSLVCRLLLYVELPNICRSDCV